MTPFWRARISRGANLTRAKLRDAILIEADLAGADLFEADLSGADLRMANLADARMGRATNVTRQQLVRACVSEGEPHPTLPEGIPPIDWSERPC